MKSTQQSRRSLPAATRAIALAVAALLWIPSLLVASAQKPQQKPATQTSAQRRIRPSIPSANHAQPDKVFLEYADRLSYVEKPRMSPDDQYQLVEGNVRLRKGGMFMYCDSAYFYENTNSVEAFGNVRMEQGDTLFVFADYLDYNGLDQMAILYADAGKKVRLRNRDVTLTTDIFNYDMEAGIGFYEVGGELTDKQNRLTSLRGEYNTHTKQSFFNDDVHLVSRSKDDVLYINTDALEYNTYTRIAELVSPSEIINKDGTIHTSSGRYNTISGVADLYERSTVVTNKGNTLTGDTLVYDRASQRGWAYGNMVLVDTTRKTTLSGNYGFYDELRDSAFVTGRALVKEYSRSDTLYLHGDSIEAYVDLADSTKVTNAYHRVRFYRTDIQGLCDSLSLTERDSMMWMYRKPVIWNGERQVSGNQINVHMADSTADWARLPRTGVLAEHIAEDCYNQLSGNDMTVWMADSTVRRLYTEGNVEVIVFPMESDSTYNKYAYVESSYMDSYFSNNQIESIHFWPETNTKITPLYLAKRNSYFLPKFQWLEDLRPYAWFDVFNVPEGMEQLLSGAPAIEQGPAGPGGPKNEARPNPSAPADRTAAPPMPEHLDLSEPLEKPRLSPDGMMMPVDDSPMPRERPGELPSGKPEKPLPKGRPTLPQ